MLKHQATDAMYKSYLFKNNKHKCKKINTMNMEKLDPNRWYVACQSKGYIFIKILAPVSYFSNLKWIAYKFFSLNLNI